MIGAQISKNQMIASKYQGFSRTWLNTLVHKKKKCIWKMGMLFKKKHRDNKDSPTELPLETGKEQQESKKPF